MEETKKEEMRGGKIYEKRQSVRIQVDIWMQEHKFPDDIQNEIRNSIEQALKSNKDVDVNNPFLILYPKTKISIKRFLFMDTLRTVNILKDTNQRVLELMCDYLKPVTYSFNSFVFRSCSLSKGQYGPTRRVIVMLRQESHQWPSSPSGKVTFTGKSFSIGHQTVSPNFQSPANMSKVRQK
ncbi:hypothetical protein FF1_042087 [Malus domestica]